MPPRLLIAALAALALACNPSASEDAAPATLDTATIDAAAAEITPARIVTHLKTLSADDMQGRGPGTFGAARARDYLIAELEAAGAKPGHAGAWDQKVPMRQVTCSDQSLTFRRDGEDWTPKNGPEYVLGSLRGPGLHQARGLEVVFVGHGVQAPEYGWDDYKGLDCKGKLLVMLVGDPPVEDDALFGGEAMTYYGRWTYKYEKAREMGAAGCIVVHRTSWAGYGWPVVFNSWGQPRMDLAGGKPNEKYGFRGWLTWEAADRLVRASGAGIEELAERARKADFRPVPLGWKADLAVTNAQVELEDVNVVGAIAGSDPKLRDEWIIFTAHYDHLGVNEAEQAKGKDGIYNGALDNASGCAGILAVARAWGKLDPKPKRSAMFLFVGSEEKGLLGSAYYAAHPIVPLEKTLANINVDGLAVRERTDDVEVVGSGQSDLEDRLAEVLAREGRHTAPDSESQNGYYYRSDHFNFARVGVPALYVKAGRIVPGKPENYLKDLADTWRLNDYHRPSDEYDPAWTCEGGAADAQALFRVGVAVAEGSAWPRWKDGSEFKARREASLKR